jgi:SAM-dependent methyltransferase
MKANAFSRLLAARLQGYFIHPTGVGGSIAGWVMAHRSSNRRRNAWVVSLLDVQPRDRVLEIGFGPGVAIQHLAQRASKGLVCGIDSSAVMLRQARRRNAAAVSAGRVDLRLASVEQLPAFDEPFHKILSVLGAAREAAPYAAPRRHDRNRNAAARTGRDRRDVAQTRCGDRRAAGGGGVLTDQAGDIAAPTCCGVRDRRERRPPTLKT